MFGFHHPFIVNSPVVDKELKKKKKERERERGGGGGGLQDRECGGDFRTERGVRVGGYFRTERGGYYRTERVVGTSGQREGWVLQDRERGGYFRTGVLQDKVFFFSFHICNLDNITQVTLRPPPAPWAPTTSARYAIIMKGTKVQTLSVVKSFADRNS